MCVELEKLIRHSKHIKDEWGESELLATQRQEEMDLSIAYTDLLEVKKYCIHQILGQMLSLYEATLLSQGTHMQPWPAVELWHQETEEEVAKIQ